MGVKCKGRAWKFGADINTDVILPTKYMNLRDPKELAIHCMENENPRFAKEAKVGDIMVADKNFGCGSSREHAPISIKGKGICCVVAKTFARIFYRNAINIGLPVLVNADAAAEISDGDEVEIDLDKGQIKDITTGSDYDMPPLPDFIQEVITSGGYINYTKKQLAGK